VSKEAHLGLACLVKGDLPPIWPPRSSTLLRNLGILVLPHTYN
jgi:hypothetical protein